MLATTIAITVLQNSFHRCCITLPRLRHVMLWLFTFTQFFATYTYWCNYCTVENEVLKGKDKDSIRKLLLFCSYSPPPVEGADPPLPPYFSVPVFHMEIHIRQPAVNKHLGWHELHHQRNRPSLIHSHKSKRSTTQHWLCQPTLPLPLPLTVPLISQRADLCVASRRLEPLGSNPCTWGPSYWCKNMQTALKCGVSLSPSVNVCLAENY